MGFKTLSTDRPDKPQSSKRLLKGSAAFTTALLFGNAETGSKGVLRTLGAASAVAMLGATKCLASMAAQSSTKEEEDAGIIEDGWGWGADGYGYYRGGFRMPSPEDDD